MLTTVPAFAFALAALAGMLVMLEVGRRLSLRWRVGQDEEKAGLGTVKGIVFGLTSLVLAFSFSGAISRYDARRDLIVVEANDIGTAYLRVDLLPAEAQPPIRDLYRRYVDSRIAVYKALPDIDAALAELTRAKGLQGEIWTASLAAANGASPAVVTLVVTSMNDMIDITTTRTVAAMSHPPTVIFAMLFGLMLASAFIAGQDMAANPARTLRHYLAFAVVLALTAFVILEIEYPRAGLIRLTAFDQLLVDVRQDMR
jgi:hypothetical protein